MEKSNVEVNRQKNRQRLIALGIAFLFITGIYTVDRLNKNQETINPETPTEVESTLNETENTENDEQVEVKSSENPNYNYTETVSSIPESAQTVLNETINLFLTKTNNSEPFDPSKAGIRDGSFEVGTNEDGDMGKAKMVVDLPIEQKSFIAYIGWYVNPDKPSITPWSSNTGVKCLDGSKGQEIIYPEFSGDKCIDRNTAHEKYLEKGENAILEHLPHTTYNYIIKADTDKNGDVSGLTIDLILYSYDTREQSAEVAIAGYKKEINEWIRSVGVDPDNLELNYIIH
jgi:hypothetical protein